MARCLMVQGTASHAGKSILCTALCRIFWQDGFRVAPFKAQNMALNSYVTRDGGEIGRAQGVQAEACGIEATVDMNPILLKPRQDTVAEVIVRGRSVGSFSAKDYRRECLPRLMAQVADSLARLRSQYDIVVIEGAGSPAEINLRDSDIANMRTAEMADAPVILVSDIDRGGVFASLIGTMELLHPHERERVGGFVINRFRGDRSLLEPGLVFLEERSGKPVLGVIPYIKDLLIDQEDSVSLGPAFSRGQGGGAEEPAGGAALDIAVIRLPRISNFTDFLPLEAEPGVRVRYVESVDALGTPDAVIIPGTRSTFDDLAFLRETGLARAIEQLARRGTPVAGICGGYQILGEAILDPHGVEGSARVAEGLGLLHHRTVFMREKVTVRAEGEVLPGPGFMQGIGGLRVEGYEIHLGRTVAEGTAGGLTGARGGDRPLLRITRRFGASGGNGEVPGGVTDAAHDGGVSEDGLVFGTYLHGIFDNDGFRRAWLDWLSTRKASFFAHHRYADGAGRPAVQCGAEMGAHPNSSGLRQTQYDRLAEVVRASLDMKAVYALLGRPLVTWPVLKR